MVSKRKPAGPSWQILLEEMRSQNRATIEVVQATRLALEEKIDRNDRDSRERDAALAAAVRQNSSDIQELQVTVRQNSADIQELQKTVQQHTTEIRGLDVRLQENTLGLRELTLKVDGVLRLEQRVAALEKRSA